MLSPYDQLIGIDRDVKHKQLTDYMEALKHSNILSLPLYKIRDFPGGISIHIQVRGYIADDRIIIKFTNPHRREFLKQAAACLHNGMARGIHF